jgi:hypothetical protein
MSGYETNISVPSIFIQCTDGNKGNRPKGHLSATL